MAFDRYSKSADDVLVHLTDQEIHQIIEVLYFRNFSKWFFRKIRDISSSNIRFAGDPGTAVILNQLEVDLRLYPTKTAAEKQKIKDTYKEILITIWQLSIEKNDEQFVNEYINLLFSDFTVSEEALNFVRKLDVRSARDNIFGHREEELKKLESLTQNVDLYSFLEENLKQLTLGESDLRFILSVAQKIQKKKAEEQFEFTDYYTPRPPDIKRALEGKPHYIRTIEEESKEVQRKKIIIHFPDIKLLDDDLERINNMLLTLTAIGIFEHVYSTFIINDISISSEALKKILSDQHKEINDYYIFDYAELLAFKQDFDIDSIMIDAINVDDSTLEVLANIESITLCDDEDLDDERYDEKVNQILHALKALKYFNISCEKNITKIFFPEEAYKLKEIQVAMKKITSLNLSHATSLEVLSLDAKRLIGALDLSQLPNLKTVSFYNFKDIDEIIIDQTQIQSVTFDFSRSPWLTKDERSLEHIRKLYAQGAKIILTGDKVEPQGNILENNVASYEMQKISIDQPISVHEVKSLLNENGAVNASEYRKNIVTGIKIINEKLKFETFVLDEKNSTEINLSDIETANASAFNKDMVKKLNKDQQVQDSFVGIMYLSTNNPQWIPFKGLSLNDELKLLDKDSLHSFRKYGIKPEIRYVESTRQYFMRLVKTDLATTVPEQIPLYFAMTPTKKWPAQVEMKPVELPEELRVEIEAWEQNFGVGKVMAALTPLTRINYLIQFCSRFDDKNILKEKTQKQTDFFEERQIANEDIRKFMENILLKAGSCHHRSTAFMALANYFGIPARVNANDSHKFVEYFDGTKWQLCNTLGGSYAIEHTVDPWASVASATTREEKKPEENEFAHLFRADEKFLEESKGFDSWYSVLQALPGFAPLLQFNNETDPLKFHSRLLQDPVKHNFGVNYFYIQSPDDFERLLTPLEVKEHECFAVEGPLLKMLRNSNSTGTILVDWTRFTATQIGIYKSILDEYPSLYGYQIPHGIKIINMSRPNTEACSAFHSRTQKVAWPQYPDTLAGTLTKMPFQQYTKTEELKVPSVNLYESLNWENILFGFPKISKDGFVFNEGELLKAIKKPPFRLHLTGIPFSNPSFNRFIDRVQYEKRFFANGTWHTIPDNFTFYYSDAPIKINYPLPEFLHDTVNAPVFYINKQNSNTFFELFHIDANNQVEQRDGLFSGMPNGSTLVITDHLTNGEIAQLLDTINALQEKKPSKKIHLKILPHLNNLATPAPDRRAIPLGDVMPASTAVILTDDVNAAAKILKDEKKVDEKIEVVNISTVTKFSDLFDEAYKIPANQAEPNKLILGKQTLRFHHETFNLLEKLRKGETVVLKGDISSELYHQFETLFSNPSYLVINGIYEEIKGKLILITPEKRYLPRLFDGAAHQYTHSFSWDNVPRYLMDQMAIETESVAKVIADKIKLFYEHAQRIPHDGKTTPPHLLLTEDRVLQIARAMRDNKELENPIEDIFLQNYTENKEAFAELTKLAKEFLSTPADVKEIPVSLKPLDMQQEDHIRKILETSPFVELRGSPGTGKTHFIEHFCKDGLPFLGESKIIEWLTLDPNRSDRSQKRYLLLDEANMKEPGYWDFLKGLETGTIYYKGIPYTVDPAIQNVICTGNPENFPGRYYHDFLQQIPKVNFKSHTDQYLTDKIILTRLNSVVKLDENIKNEIARQFIYAYKLAKKQLPYEHISIRDINSLLDHFLFPNKPNNEDALARAHLACQEVFAGLFKTATSRAAYLAALQQNFVCEKAPLKALPTTHKNYILPDSRQLVWNNVNRCIEISKDKSLPPGARRAVLVEGPSGIGKTKMMIKALKDQGFKKYEENITPNDNSPIYIHLTMGTHNVSEILRKANELKRIRPVALVLDELNFLQHEDEVLLTALLEGREIDTVKSKTDAKDEKTADQTNQYKLIVLASQNSQLEAGRKRLSHALLNRFDRVYEGENTEADLLEICAKSKAFSKDHDQIRMKKFVARYLEGHKNNPVAVNDRTFYEELKKLGKQVNLSPLFKSTTAETPQSDVQPSTKLRKTST